MLFVQDERALLFLFLKLGPALILWGHSIVEIQGDVFLFGGFGSGSYNSAIYQLSCSSGICSLATLNQALKLWRRNTVAITVPDSFCLEEGNGTTSSITTSSSGTTSTTTTTTTSGGCNQGWTGDGYCDDINNNIGCNFDGGDCLI